jgi:hypothetical protein
MYKIQNIFNDINEEQYNASCINYGDDVYIFVDKGFSFNDLIKIKVEEIIEINNSGIVIRGFQIYFDDNEDEFKQYYTGIFVYKIENNFVLTNEGYKIPIYDNNKLCLLNYEEIEGKKFLECEFKIDKFTIILNIGGNVCFSDEEIKTFISNIKFDYCKAYKNKIVLSINNKKIIFKEFTVKYNNKIISYDDFFNYAINNLKCSNNAVYPINKIFSLSPGEFIIFEY